MFSYIHLSKLNLKMSGQFHLEIWLRNKWTNNYSPSLWGKRLLKQFIRKFNVKKCGPTHASTKIDYIFFGFNSQTPIYTWNQNNLLSYENMNLYSTNIIKCMTHFFGKTAPYCYQKYEICVHSNIMPPKVCTIDLKRIN